MDLSQNICVKNQKKLNSMMNSKLEHIRQKVPKNKEHINEQIN